jgi:hypothetical protein
MSGQQPLDKQHSPKNFAGLQPSIPFFLCLFSRRTKFLFLERQLLSVCKYERLFRTYNSCPLFWNNRLVFRCDKPHKNQQCFLVFSPLLQFLFELIQADRKNPILSFQSWILIYLSSVVKAKPIQTQILRLPKLLACRIGGLHIYL